MSLLSPRWETKVLVFRRTARRWLSRGVSRVSPVAATLLSLLGLLGYRPAFSPALQRIQNSQGVHLAAGALIGTILALSVSLSIIPIQRAAETFTPSISRIFREDRRLALGFGALIFLCLLSFSFTLGSPFGFNPSLLLPAQVVILGVAFDLLRFNYRSILQLIEPGEAIRRLLKHAIDFIAVRHAAMRKSADLLSRSLPEAERAKANRDALTAAVYERTIEDDRALETWASELTEVSQRAIDRGAGVLAGTAIRAIQQLAVSYIEVRKDNITLTPITLGSLRSSADHVLTPLYEDLIAINRSTVVRGLENVSIAVIHALGGLTEHMANLKSAMFREGTAPLASAPLYYCRVCARSALEKGLVDSGLQGAAALKNISAKTPDNIIVSEVHLHVIDGLFEITNTFLTTPGKASLANESLKQVLEVLHLLCERKYYGLDHVLADVLRRLAGILPIALILQDKSLGGLMYAPLGPAYDVSYAYSLPCLVGRATGLVQVDPERDWIDPWGAFRRFNHDLTQHFRHLSENPGLATSHLLFYLNQAVQFISSIYLHQMVEARRSRPSSVDELERQVRWYNSFFWSVFRSAEKIEFGRVHESTECLGSIGLTFLDADFVDVALNAAGNIVSVVESCSTKMPAALPNRLAELLMPIRLMRFLARLDGTPELLDRFAQVERKAAEKLADWDQIVSTLDHRQEEILLELDQLHGASLPDPDSPEGILVRILARRDREQAEQPPQGEPAPQAAQPPEAEPPQPAQAKQPRQAEQVPQAELPPHVQEPPKPAAPS